jgi:hypothetical protein
MSTVQNILDNIQFRADVTADLYHIFNLSIRTIAKRLFILESDIIRSEMSMTIWAEDVYTASTIAFVDGGTGADTITDTANGFVTEGFSAGMPLTSDNASNPGPYKIITSAAGTITLTTGELTAATAGSPVTLTSLDTFGYLPADFWGLIEKPYLSGKTYPLQPLPNQSTALHYVSAGEPRYYKLKGERLYVYPKTSADYTVKCDYFAAPSLVSAVTSTIPYIGLFDDAIGEMVIRNYTTGEKVMLSTNSFEAYLHGEVDRIAGKRDFKAPKESPMGIDWDGMF